MKTTLPFIQSIVFLAALCAIFILPFSGIAQQNKGESKQQKKEREKTEQIQRYEMAKQLVMDTAFVVQAESIQFRDGSMMTMVQESINFLKMDREYAVLQIGSDFARTSGLNNLGGITLKGKILNLKIKEKESKNSIFMTFTLTGVLGTARISFSLTGSEKAIIDVDGMFSGRAFSMRGPVKRLQDANIFEGTEF